MSILKINRSLGFVSLIGLLISVAGCGGSSGNKKRNQYLLAVSVPHCGVNINQMYPAQRDLCGRIIYENQRSNCAFNEFQLAYSDNSCQSLNLDGGSVFITNQFQTGSTTDPKVDDNLIIELEDSYESILDYYTQEGCDIYIKGTTIVLDACAFDEDGNEKDAPDTYYPSAPEKDDRDVYVTPTPEKDEDDNTTSAAEPVATTPPKKDETSTPPVVKPAPGNEQLAFNLVKFNTRGALIDEIQGRTILKITGISDPKSPITGLKHTVPNAIMSVTLKNVSTTCDIKGQLSSSGDTVVITLLPDSNSTASQLEVCKKTLNDLADSSNIEFSFDSPLKMSNNKEITPDFKLTK